MKLKGIKQVDGLSDEVSGQLLVAQVPLVIVRSSLFYCLVL